MPTWQSSGEDTRLDLAFGRPDSALHPVVQNFCTPDWEEVKFDRFALSFSEEEARLQHGLVKPVVLPGDPDFLSAAFEDAAALARLAPADPYWGTGNVFIAEIEKCVRRKVSPAGLARSESGPLTVAWGTHTAKVDLATILALAEAERDKERWRKHVGDGGRGRGTVFNAVQFLQGRLGKLPTSPRLHVVTLPERSRLARNEDFLRGHMHPNRVLEKNPKFARDAPLGGRAECWVALTRWALANPEVRFEDQTGLLRFEVSAPGGTALLVSDGANSLRELLGRAHFLLVEWEGVILLLDTRSLLCNLVEWLRMGLATRSPEGVRLPLGRLLTASGEDYAPGLCRLFEEMKLSSEGLPARMSLK